MFHPGYPLFSRKSDRGGSKSTEIGGVKKNRDGGNGFGRGFAGGGSDLPAGSVRRHLGRGGGIPSKNLPRRQRRGFT